MKTLFFISFALAFHDIFSQKMSSDYFEEASQHYEENNYEKALSGYQYIVENYPKSELYSKSYYNVGYIYYTQKKYKEAIPIFQNILQSNFNEKEALGGGIMADPYANFKHRACEILSNIYYTNKKYDQALQYFALGDTAYPYLHFCGNEYAENDVHTAIRYADIYQKLQKTQKAIEALLPAVFITAANNSTVIKELKKSLSGKPNLKLELDESLKNIYSKKITKSTYSYKRYYFMFLNTEIEVPDSYGNDKEKFEKDKAITEIKQTDFYKMIGQL